MKVEIKHLLAIYVAIDRAMIAMEHNPLPDNQKSYNDLNQARIMVRGLIELSGASIDIDTGPNRPV